MRNFLLVCLLSAGCGASLLAAEYPPVIKHMVDEQDFKVLANFNAAGGLTGYAGTVHGHDVILYALPDGKHALAGTLFNAQGDNLTAAQADKYFKQPLNAVAWKKLRRATWISEGATHSKRIIYEFTDPNCPYCHLLWLANQTYMKHGLQVRHILVGVITKSSIKKAAAILSSSDPRAAYIKNERNYKAHGVPENKAGGIAPAAHPKAQTLKNIRANEALMRSLGVNGTPGVFYKDAQGQVQRFVGLPQLSKLADIYRLPKQPITNPALKKYK